MCVRVCVRLTFVRVCSGGDLATFLLCAVDVSMRRDYPPCYCVVVVLASFDPLIVIRDIKLRNIHSVYKNLF